MTVTPFTEEEQARFAGLAERVAGELASIPSDYVLKDGEFTGRIYHAQTVADGESITPRHANDRLAELVKAGSLNMKKEKIGRNQTNVYWWPEEGDEDPPVRVGRNGAGFSVVSAKGKDNESNRR